VKGKAQCRRADEDQTFGLMYCVHDNQQYRNLKNKTVSECRKQLNNATACAWKQTSLKAIIIEIADGHRKRKERASPRLNTWQKLHNTCPRYSHSTTTGLAIPEARRSLVESPSVEILVHLRTREVRRITRECGRPDVLVSTSMLLCYIADREKDGEKKDNPFNPDKGLEGLQISTPSLLI